MQTPVNEAVVRAKLMVWWVIWFSMISGLCVLYFFLARPVAASETVEVGLFD